jgi:hypothetical protein
MSAPARARNAPASPGLAQVIAAVEIAARQGLRLPLVYKLQSDESGSVQHRDKRCCIQAVTVAHPNAWLESRATQRCPKRVYTGRNVPLRRSDILAERLVARRRCSGFSRSCLDLDQTSPALVALGSPLAVRLSIGRRESPSVQHPHLNAPCAVRTERSRRREQSPTCSRAP